MSIFSWAFQSNAQLGQSELPEIFPLSLQNKDFCRQDIFTTYSKILTDVADRIHGMKKDHEPLLWDSCVQSESSVGLISYLADAMAVATDLFLVYKAGVLRKATHEEQEQIKRDYATRAESSLGIYVSFKSYHRTEMLKVYSLLEYCILCSLHKTVNLSKAVQVKINDLRGSVALNDAEIARAQGVSIAEALGRGSDIMVDAKDTIETAVPNIEPTEKAITFLDAKRAFLLGLPISYISGLQTPGIGSTGEADMRAVERGLKQYFSSILQPVIQSLFGSEVEYKSADFREIGSALEAAKTFDLVSNEYLSPEAKKEILARMFDLDPEEEEKNIEAAQAEQVDAQAQAAEQADADQVQAD